MWIYANQHPSDFFWLAFWVIVGATIVGTYAFECLGHTLKRK